VARGKRRATYEDLKEVPDILVAELIDGELFTTPRPASPHAHAAMMLGSDLNGAFGRPPGAPPHPGGWWLLFEPELHFGDDVLVPDVAAWRRARMPVMPNTAAFTLPPDWVCEVVSPRTATLDRTHKMRIYAREGVAHLWIVDPLLRVLEIHGLRRGRWVLASSHGNGDVVRAEPFDAVELGLERWWLEGVILFEPGTPSGEIVA
jgi:Uma2 family endonuclease